MAKPTHISKTITTVKKDLTEKTDKPKNKSVTGKNGGRRPGAGRPKGSMNTKTKELMEVKKELQQRIAANVNKLLAAQLNMAIGSRELYKREVIDRGKDKEPKVSVRRVVTEDDFIKFLEHTKDGQSAKIGNIEYYYQAFSGSGNPVALNSLFDRAFGKPAQSMEMSGEQKYIVETRVRGAK